MADCCSAPGLLAFEAALSKLTEAVTPVTETELINLDEALDRILAVNVTSPINVPPHDNSAMDGYAFAHQSLVANNTLKVVGKAMAGAPFTGVCQVGECVRIMTGAKMPSDCDSVVMQEQTQVQENLVTINASAKLGSHVRKAGEDIEQGATVLSQGKRLTAVDIGLLSSLGVAKVEVYRKLTVALIATGDELKLPGEQLADGNIYESNGIVLRQILRKLNLNIIDFGIIEDDCQLIKQAFVEADQQADVVISSGGVSVGDADYTKAVLDELGQINFWKIAMKPGKPFAFGQLPNSVFIGLPGNPVSALVTFYQLGMLAINKMQGAMPLNRLKVTAITTTDLKKSPGRKDFQRGVLIQTDTGEMQVTSTGSQGSGILSSLGKANCFIVLSAEQGKVAAGETVSVELFDQYLQ